MKIIIYCFFLLCIILYSCSYDRNQTPGESLNTDYSENDTVFVNDILNWVSQYEFKSTDSAYKYLVIAEELSQNCDYINWIVTALFLKGNLLYRENKYEEALNSYSSALSFTENLENPLLRAKCLERMASVNLSLGDDHLSLKLYYEPLALFEQANDKEGIAKVYNILGVSKSNRGNTIRQLIIFRKR